MTVNELKDILSKVDGDSEVHLYSFGESVDVEIIIESGTVTLSSCATSESEYYMFD